MIPQTGVPVGWSGPTGLRALALVLAGGQGTRLMPLTADAAKPATRFAASYRLIDFVLSNLVNSGFHRIAVLTQYKSHQLNMHLRRWELTEMLGSYISPEPAQQRLGPRWEAGTADAIYQHLNLVAAERPDIALIFAADHVYKMDVRQMVEQHLVSGAAVTVAATRVPRREASGYGIVEADGTGRIIRFIEKPADPPGMPDEPDVSYASMGNYVFDVDALIETLIDDARNLGSAHDLARNIVPVLVESGDARVYDFARNEIPGEPARGFWQDVGTIDAFHRAHLDLLGFRPPLDLHNLNWPILAVLAPFPPVHITTGEVEDSLLAPGVVCAGTARRSVLSPGVRILQGGHVENSVVMDNVVIGAGALVRNAVIGENALVEAGEQVGVDPAVDRTRFTVTERDVVAVGAGMRVGSYREWDGW